MKNRIKLVGPSTLLPETFGELGAELYDSMKQGLAEADVVMMLRLQRERMESGLIPSEREYFHRYGLDNQKLKFAKKVQ